MRQERKRGGRSRLKITVNLKKAEEPFAWSRGVLNVARFSPRLYLGISVPQCSNLEIS